MRNRGILERQPDVMVRSECDHLVWRGRRGMNDIEQRRLGGRLIAQQGNIPAAIVATKRELQRDGGLRGSSHDKFETAVGTDGLREPIKAQRLVLWPTHWRD